MKTEDLDRIEREMTPGDWWISDEDGSFCTGDPGPGATEIGPTDLGGRNEYGVVTLRNHFRAVVDLLQALDKRRATLCYSVSVHEPQRAQECQCSALYAPECPVRAADRAVAAAHAKIEAIG